MTKDKYFNNLFFGIPLGTDGITIRSDQMKTFEKVRFCLKIKAGEEPFGLDLTAEGINRRNTLSYFGD